MNRILLGLALLAAGCRYEVPKIAKTDPVPEPVGLTSADQLWYDYEANPAAADMKYRDKFFKIVGRVHRVEKNDQGIYTIGFTVAPKSETPPDGLPPSVVCRVVASSKIDFTSLSELQIIHLVARVVGRKKADVWRGFFVEAVDARYVED